MREQVPHMKDRVQHDLRRTWRSLMPRCGVSDTDAERTYGHRIGGVQGIYNRHTYFEKKVRGVAKAGQPDRDDRESAVD